MKILDLIAYIGGLMKILIGISKFLILPISLLSMQTALLNELFNFEDA